MKESINLETCSSEVLDALIATKTIDRSQLKLISKIEIDLYACHIDIIYALLESELTGIEDLEAKVEPILLKLQFLMEARFPLPQEIIDIASGKIRRVTD